MTVSTSQVRVAYTTDGSTVAFAIPFAFYLAADIAVWLGDTKQTSGFTISGGMDSSGDPQTGTCTFSTAPTSGQTLQLILDPPGTQLVELVDGTAFPSPTLNQVFDRAVQLSDRRIDWEMRSIRAPDGDLSPTMLLPAATTRANMSLLFDANGNLMLGTPITGTLTGPLIASLLSLVTSSPALPSLVQSAAEVAAGVTPSNYAYAPGTVDRYGANTVPGTTNMMAAIRAAFAQAAQPGGAPVSFLASVEYFVGTITSVNTQLIPVTGLTDCVVYGNGAIITSDTTVNNPNGTPQIFYFLNCAGLTIYNLGCYDSGYNSAVQWQGPTFVTFANNTSTDLRGYRLVGCDFASVVSAVTFSDVAGGTGRMRGVVFDGCTYNNVFYGPSFENQGDDADIFVTLYNPVRAYFPYGVHGHRAVINVYHDSTSTGSNACVDIKRYDRDTGDINVRVNWHGYVTQYQALVNLETQGSTGTLGATELSVTNAGSGGTEGLYLGVPTSGGSGTGLTLNVWVGSGGTVLIAKIADRGSGYLSTDTGLTATSADMGNCAGFTFSVTGVGAAIDGIDIDVHMLDAQCAAGSANIPAVLQIRSYTPGGVLNTTTTDVFDRISLKGNQGQRVTINQLVNIASVQTAVVGRLAIDPGLFDAIQYGVQVFPGFSVRTRQDEYFLSELGNLTTTPMVIDLTPYIYGPFALRVTVSATSDYTSSSNQQTTEYIVQGYISVSGAIGINYVDQIYTTGGPTTCLSSQPFGTGTYSLTVTFTNYTGATATARMHVRDLGRLAA